MRIDNVPFNGHPIANALTHMAIFLLVLCLIGCGQRTRPGDMSPDETAWINKHLP